jgi:succinate dehydrogenase / fumarate reductase cytochrome b subunit
MADAKARIERPLSPHLQIYGWSWTMAMSIFHRATGVANYVGTVLVAVWLLAMATSPAAYDAVQGFFGSIIGRLILFGYTWSLMHHMLGGVRHLVWDFGHGMERETRKNMARFTLIGSVALTLVIWVVASFMH